ncbi:MAG: substrate-binding periplasmic protein [Pseudomonadales bacterium]
MSGGASAETIRIGFFGLEPQMFVGDDKRPRGAAVDYWEQHLAPAMGVQIEWRGPENIKRLNRQVIKGEIDAILLFAKNPERERQLLYPEFPFTQMIAGLALQKDHALERMHSIEDLSALKVCSLAGGVVPPLLLRATIYWRHNYSPARWSDECLRETAAGTVDATFNAMSSVLLYDLRKRGFAEQLKLVSLPGTELALYTAFSKRADPTLLARYNRAHNQLRQQVEYSSLERPYLQ